MPFGITPNFLINKNDHKTQIKKRSKNLLTVTAKQPSYKVQFKVTATPIKFSECIKTISNCLDILFVFSKKMRSVVFRDIQSPAT